eukprot:COSAG02_NODE_20215_length_842_cov_1.554509_1_plen_119_part_00
MYLKNGTFFQYRLQNNSIQITLALDFARTRIALAREAGERSRTTSGGDGGESGESGGEIEQSLRNRSVGCCGIIGCESAMSCLRISLLHQPSVGQYPADLYINAIGIPTRTAEFASDS